MQGRSVKMLREEFEDGGFMAHKDCGTSPTHNVGRHSSDEEGD